MKWKSIVLDLVIIICFSLCGFSGWKIWDHMETDRRAKSTNDSLARYIQIMPEHELVVDELVSGEGETQEYIEVPVFEVNWKELKEKNPDVVGWIIVNGTDISMPIMQGKDNQFYLNHDSSGAPNYLGAVFLDCNVKPDFQADNSIIFGHTVAYTGGIFTDLSRFVDKSFFDTYKTFWILTPESNYVCRITDFGIGSDGTADYIRDFGNERDEVLSRLREKSIYYRDVPGADKFVTLSTCRMNGKWFTGDMYTLRAAVYPYKYAVRSE